MKIPDEYLDGLRDHAPIDKVAALFTDLSPDGPNRLKGLCPSHDEKTASFKVDTKDNHCHCYGCGMGGDCITLVQEVKHLQFRDAVTWLAEQFNYPPPPRNQAEIDPESKRRGVMRWAHSETQTLYERTLWEDAQAAPALKYLKSRGFTDETLKQFGVGFACNRQTFMATVGKAFNWGILKDCSLAAQRTDPNTPGKEFTSPFFNGRITFPIRTESGAVVGFGARKIADDSPGPKYLNSADSPIFTKGVRLFGLYESLQTDAQREDRRKLRITEGYTDVLRSHQLGLGRTVAPLGTAFTKQQASLCFRYADNLYFYFDGDNAGRKAAFSACETIMPYINGDRKAYFVLLPQGEDFDTILRSKGADGVREMEKKAIPMSVFLMRHAESQHDCRTLEGRTKVFKMLSAIADQAVDEDFRRILDGEIRRRYMPPAEEALSSDVSPDSYLPLLPPRAAGVIKGCRPEFIAVCGTIVSHPYWRPLVEEVSRPLASEENELLEFAIAMSDRAMNSSQPIEDLFPTAYRYLVMYLKATGESMTEQDRVATVVALRNELSERHSTLLNNESAISSPRKSGSVGM